MSAGGASMKRVDTQNDIELVGGDKMNQSYQSHEQTKEDKSNGDIDQKDNYRRPGNEEEMAEAAGRENVYHTLERPLDNDDDYADPDEEEMNNIYYVLEGPTPKEEEEEEEREREKVDRQEQLTEPTAYEVPLSSKHNSTIQ